jgi:hypothetical protein
MVRFYKFFILFFFSVVISLNITGQTVNYWSLNLNSEAALLGGAVVGGGSGVTSIFYNPAGISEITKSNVTLNSSMFNMVSKSLKNALGEDQDLSQLTIEVKPRFVSYQFRSKKIVELSWEISMFNKESKNNFFYGTYNSSAEKYGLTNGEKYFGIFDYWERFNDYWSGIGTAYEINDQWKIGASIFVSIKDLRVFNNTESAIYQEVAGFKNNSISDWNQYKLVSLFEVRLAPIFGVRYYFSKEISIGLTIHFPTMRVFGYANEKKILSHQNIVDNNGFPVPDKLQQEAPEFVRGQLKDPWSIAFGMTRRPVASKNIYSITIEWFAKLRPYKAIDAEKGKSIFGEEVYGTEFSNYYMGNRSVINFAFGYKREVRENLELLFGFKSDFFSYQLPKSFIEKHKTANTFISVGTDMLHFSSGANFIFRKKFKINLGGSLSYGRTINQKQLSNFVDPNWYDPNTELALQGKKQNTLTYRQIMLGLYLGFSLDF